MGSSEKEEGKGVQKRKIPLLMEEGEKRRGGRLASDGLTEGWGIFILQNNEDYW